MKNRGNSTLEILIAFAVLITCISAVIMVWFTNQSVAIDTANSEEALSKARQILEKARADARNDFNLVSNYSVNEMSGPLQFIKSLSVNDVTECKKEATSTVIWQADGKKIEISLGTIISDVNGLVLMGGDCIVNPPDSNWDNPQRFASDTLNPGKSTSIDVLNKIVFIGSDKQPYLKIADTKAAYFGQTNGLFVNYLNGFNVEDKVNDVDAISWKDPSTGVNKIYAFLAVASSTKQLAVVDATDIQKPTIVARRQLKNVDPNGSQPFGNLVYYYDNKLYVLTKETAGPEFHIFDVTDPTNPVEIGPGTKLVGPTPPNGTTVNDIVVRDDIAYMAAQKDSSELMIYDVSNPVSPAFLSGASVDLPGTQNGTSVFLLGKKLYFGRQSTSGGPELYIFDVSNVKTITGGVPVIGSPAEIGSDVLDIIVVSRYGFIVSSKSKEEFQVWNISNPNNISNIAKYNFGNIVAGGIDYEPDFIYSTGDATPNFQILFSPPKP